MDRQVSSHRPKYPRKWMLRVRTTLIYSTTTITIAYLYSLHTSMHVCIHTLHTYTQTYCSVSIITYIQSKIDEYCAYIHAHTFIQSIRFHAYNVGIFFKLFPIFVFRCQVRIWNIAQSCCVNMARFEYSIISLSFHPAGSYLAVATGSKVYKYIHTVAITIMDRLYKQYKYLFIYICMYVCMYFIFLPVDLLSFRSWKCGSGTAAVMA